MSRQQVLALLDPTCAVRYRDGGLEADCRAFASPACNCALARASSLRLELDGKRRLRSWSSETRLTTVRAPPPAPHSP